MIFLALDPCQKQPQCQNEAAFPVGIGPVPKRLPSCNFLGFWHWTRAKSLGNLFWHGNKVFGMGLALFWHGNGLFGIGFKISCLFLAWEALWGRPPRRPDRRPGPPSCLEKWLPVYVKRQFGSETRLSSTRNTHLQQLS